MNQVNYIEIEEFQKAVAFNNTKHIKENIANIQEQLTIEQASLFISIASFNGHLEIVKLFCENFKYDLTFNNCESIIAPFNNKFFHVVEYLLSIENIIPQIQENYPEIYEEIHTFVFSKKLNNF